MKYSDITENLEILNKGQAMLSHMWENIPEQLMDSMSVEVNAGVLSHILELLSAYAHTYECFDTASCPHDACAPCEETIQ